VDGNTRQLAAIYACMGMLPEIAPEDLFHPIPRSILKPVESQFVIAGCLSRFVIPASTPLSSSLNILRKYSQEIGKEKSASRARSFTDFLEKIFLILRQDKSERIVERVLRLPELQYKTKAPGGVLEPTDRVYKGEKATVKELSILPKVEAVFDFLLEHIAEEVDITGLYSEFKAYVAKITTKGSKKSKEQLKTDWMKKFFRKEGACRTRSTFSWLCC
jgi:hypothetical protein